MTNPYGKTFISYRRKRLAEVSLLIECLHEHGIPTWQDIKDLASEPTNDELDRVLHDGETANAILFLTPEVQDSPTIQRVELPQILKRHDEQDGFFITPIAAGGLLRDKVGDVASETLGIRPIGTWNMFQASEPVHASDCAAIARRVLHQRLAGIRAALPSTDPLRICLDVKGTTPGKWALHMAWHGAIAPSRSVDLWPARLIPALRAVRDEVANDADRPVLATGTPSLPAAVALGAAFLSPARGHLRWRQRLPNGAEQAWDLGVPAIDSPVSTTAVQSDLDGKAIAVLVSVSDDVENAFNHFKVGRRYRGFVRVRAPQTPARLTPGEAVEVAHKTIKAVRAARAKWAPVDRIDLFMSCPAGLAVLLGQLLNTLPPVQTFDFVHRDGVGTYQEAALLLPGLVDP